MGIHLVRFLSRRGHDVVVTSRRMQAAHDGVSYLLGNAKDEKFLAETLAERWDAIVDFMVWSTDEFSARIDGLLAATAQYVFVSSYRVYADSPVITEKSPRLLDVVDDADYLATDEYALRKARCEDMLFGSESRGWTIVRPAVTYDSSGRFQLGTHEAETWLWRALNQVEVPLPDAMMAKQTTMTWGGDVARMIVELLGNPKATGEAFNVSTAEHLSWGEVAQAYRLVVPSLEISSCSLTDYESERGGVYQIRFDRMFDRVLDNAKILDATGIEESSLRPMEEGLAGELACHLGSLPLLVPLHAGRQGKLDRLVGGLPCLLPIVRAKGVASSGKYLARRLFG